MRCLLISCSDRKSTGQAPMSALDRYDGPTFRIVRRYLRQNPGTLGKELLVRIISAKYGLLRPETIVPDYDLRMTRERALELQPQVVAALRDWLMPYRQFALFVNLGAAYQAAIEPLEAWLPESDNEVTAASGGAGKKQQQLVAWLNGTEMVTMKRTISSPTVATGRALLRGVSISATPAEIEEKVAEWLATGDQDYQRAKSWMAQVGSYTVAPKWLVSRLSGVPVSTFAADEARRVLAQLGIPVVSVGGEG